MTPPRLTACLLAAAALVTTAGPGRAEPGRSAAGLTLHAITVLDPGHEEALAQAIFWGNYPVLAAGFREGMPGRLELDARGLFDHRRVEGFGEYWSFDFDEFQGALRWNPLHDLPGGTGGSTATGFSRMYTRQKYSDGRYSFWKLRFWWAEVLAAAVSPGGAGVTIGTRWLRTVEARTDLAAMVASVVSPPLGSVTAILEGARLVRNPGRWRAPWALGLRAASGPAALTVYASNTWGPMAPDSLYGTSLTFWNVRVTLGM